MKNIKSAILSIILVVFTICPFGIYTKVTTASNGANLLKIDYILGWGARQISLDQAKAKGLYDLLVFLKISLKIL